MKRLHRPDLRCWSSFDAERDLDFHATLWVRAGGNVVIDPLPLSAHDRAQLDALGGVATIVVTNSGHIRDAAALAASTGATVCGPAGERASFALPCTRWLADDDEVVPGLTALALDGSKTPGELALVLERTTLITGDLVRAPVPGTLARLPDAKLADRAAALRSIARLGELPGLETVLVGDGWHLFHGATAALRAIR